MPVAIISGFEHSKAIYVSKIPWCLFMVVPLAKFQVQKF